MSEYSNVRITVLYDDNKNPTGNEFEWLGESNLLLFTYCFLEWVDPDVTSFARQRDISIGDDGTIGPFTLKVFAIDKDGIHCERRYGNV